MAAPATLALSLLPGASADVVFLNQSDNGFFTPFDSSNSATVKYGDSGWLTGFGAPPVSLTSITFGLCVFDSPTAGSTDMLVTINDGDPSGFVFGSGAELYSTRVHALELPATEPGSPVYFAVTIPIPLVQTLGNFNNVGWSVALSNFDYAGSFGFQVSTASGQTIGYYTNNASFFDGSSWSLFSFGPDPNFGVANYVATIEAAPNCPADLNGDGTVDGADLGLLLGQWSATRRDGANSADLNGDGVVDGADLGLLLGAWGDCA
jgi:hypothetical protein